MTVDLAVFLCAQFRGNVAGEVGGGKGYVAIALCVHFVRCLDCLKLAVCDVPDNDLLGILSGGECVGDSNGSRSAEVLDLGSGGDGEVIDRVVAQQSEFLGGKIGIRNCFLLGGVAQLTCGDADLAASNELIFDALVKAKGCFGELQLVYATKRRAAHVHRGIHGAHDGLGYTLVVRALIDGHVCGGMLVVLLPNVRLGIFVGLCFARIACGVVLTFLIVTKLGLDTVLDTGCRSGDIPIEGVLLYVFGLGLLLTAGLAISAIEDCGFTECRIIDSGSALGPCIDRMSLCCNEIALVAITAFAYGCSIALLGAGRLGYRFGICMRCKLQLFGCVGAGRLIPVVNVVEHDLFRGGVPQSLGVVVTVAVTAHTGVGRVALLGTERRGDGRLKATSVGQILLLSFAVARVRAVAVGGQGCDLMSECGNLVVNASYAAGAGIGRVALFGTGGRRDAALCPSMLVRAGGGSNSLGSAADGAGIYRALVSGNSVVPGVLRLVCDLTVVLAGGRMPVVNVIACPSVGKLMLILG